MSYSLHQCEARLEEIDRALMDPSVVSNVKKLKELSKERAHIEPMVFLWRDLERCREEIADAKEMLSDPGMKEMAEMERRTLRSTQNQEIACVPPPDP